MSGYSYGEKVFRDRRPMITNPYNPARQTLQGDWTDAVTIELDGVYVAAGSQAARQGDGVRTEVTQSMSLYSIDGNIDVKIGDRIRRANGDLYIVEVRPAGDVNPFTGWAPGVEIPLVGVIG